MSPRNDEHLKLLRELVELTRVAVYPAAKEALRDVFVDGVEPRAKRVRVYAHMDGRTQAAVAKAAGASEGSVSTWKQEWQRFGLVGDDGRAVFDIFAIFPDLEEQVSG